MNDKLPTEWDLLNKIWHIINQQVDYEILLSSEVQYEIEKHIESHTAAHTAGLREEIRQLQSDVAHNADKALEIAMERDALRERVKELEDVIRRSRNRLGNILSDDDLTDEALREHSERLLPSIHDDLNRVIYNAHLKSITDWITELETK